MNDNLIDRVCQVPCGVCCDEYWKDVEELCPEWKKQDARECPFSSNNGCTLSRDNRPNECIYFLCDISLAVHERIITKQEAEGLQKQACHNLDPKHWPLGTGI